MVSPLAHAARRGVHGLRPEASSHVAWLLRLAAGSHLLRILLDSVQNGA